MSPRYSAASSTVIKRCEIDPNQDLNWYDLRWNWEKCFWLSKKFHHLNLLTNYYNWFVHFYLFWLKHTKVNFKPKSKRGWNYITLIIAITGTNFIKKNILPHIIYIYIRSMGGWCVIQAPCWTPQPLSTKFRSLPLCGSC